MGGWSALCEKSGLGLQLWDLGCGKEVFPDGPVVSLWVSWEGRDRFGCTRRQDCKHSDLYKAAELSPAGREPFQVPLASSQEPGKLKVADLSWPQRCFDLFWVPLQSALKSTLNNTLKMTLDKPWSNLYTMQQFIPERDSLSLILLFFMFTEKISSGADPESGDPFTTLNQFHIKKFMQPIRVTVWQLLY